MYFAWLLAPSGVCLVSLLIYALAPRYHESRAERLLRRGRDREAARRFESALGIWEKRAGRNSLEAASARAGLARVRFLQNMADRGRALLDESTRCVLTYPGKPSRRLVLALARIGQASLAGERYAEAAEMGGLAEPLAARSTSRHDPLRGAIQTLLADALAGQGRFEQAHLHYESALELFRLTGGEDSPECGAVFASMSAALAREERWREAREAGLEAVEILDHAGSARLPEALDALADLHARRGRLAEAEGLRLSICHLWERLGGPESSALAREYERRARLLKAMERETEAGFLLNKAARIRRAAVNP